MGLCLLFESAYKHRPVAGYFEHSNLMNLAYSE